MKILQLTNKVPWPPKEGGTIAVFSLSKGFFLHGNKVTVLAMNTELTHFETGLIPEYLTKEINFQVVDMPYSNSPFSVLYNLFFSKLPYIATRYIQKGYKETLISILKKEKFDIIQFEGLYVCPYISIAREYSNALFSYRVHNIEHQIRQDLQPIHGIRSLYENKMAKRLKKFEISFINQYDTLVSITERDGLTWDRLGNIKPRYTSQTGINLPLLVPTVKNLEYPSLFHIGAMDWYPNQEGLLWFIHSCWPSIREKYPKLKFYIAGRNIPNWLKNTFVNAKIDFVGEVDDAYSFISSKAIMIVPVLSGSGIRIKIIEGMALGKAVVSTSIGSEGIPAIDHDNILIADNPEDFIKKIEELISNQTLFKKICKNAVDFICKKFDNLTIVGNLLKFYEGHLNKKE